MTVGNPGRVVLPFKEHQILFSVLTPGLPACLFKCKVLSTHGHMGMYDNIVLPQIRMEHRRPLRHRLLHCRNRRILFVFDFDCAQGLIARHLVLRNNCRNIVSVQTHAGIQKLPVADILMLKLRAPGMPRRRELVIRHVKARYDPHHAGYLFGL